MYFVTLASIIVIALGLIVLHYNLTHRSSELKVAGWVLIIGGITNIVAAYNIEPPFQDKVTTPPAPYYSGFTPPRPPMGPMGHGGPGIPGPIPSGLANHNVIAAPPPPSGLEVPVVPVVDVIPPSPPAVKPAPKPRKADAYSPSSAKPASN
jgi:hypothetical protein